MDNVCVFACVCTQRFYKKAAAFVLRAVAKHSPELSQAVVACGGVDALVLCLEEFDPGVKEAAAWALGNIARHNACKEFHFCLPSVVGFFKANAFSLYHFSNCMFFFKSSIFFPCCFPSLCSFVSVSRGCRCCSPAGAVHSGAWDGPQTHRSLHTQWHLQAHAWARP